MSAPLRLTVLASIIVLAACSPKTPPTTPKPSKVPVTTAPSPVSGASVTGTVMGPRDTQAGSYQLLMRADSPVNGAPVTAYETDGKTSLGTSTKSNANGKYEINGLTPEKIVLIRAVIKTPQGKTANLETLAKAGQAASADIDIASTMLTLTVLAHANGKAVSYDLIAFIKAVSALRSALDQSPVLDPTDSNTLIAKTEELARTMVDISAVTGANANASPSPSPTPAESAAPSSGPTTSPAPSLAASPTPSPVTSSSPASAAPSTSPSPSPQVPPTPGATSEGFQATLSGASLTPPVTTAAFGSVTATLAKDRSSLTLNATLTGLPLGGNAITGAELRYTTDNSLAKTVLVNGSNLSAVWAIGDSTNPLTQSAVSALEKGQVALVVNTTLHPKGELRGLLAKQP